MRSSWQVVPQSQRQEAEQIMLDREEKAPTAGVAKIPGQHRPPAPMHRDARRAHDACDDCMVLRLRSDR